MATTGGAARAEQLPSPDRRLGGGVATLKADGDGNVVVLGSGELVQQLIVDDLIDEYRLFLHPLVLGNLEFRAVVANA